MQDTDDIGSNESGNPHFTDIVAARLSRRGFMSGSVEVAAASFIGANLVAGTAEASGGARIKLGFTEVAPSQADELIVPAGYKAEVFIPWGTPLLPGAVPFNEDGSNTAAEQALQIGFNHDGMHYFPLYPFGNNRGLIALNHEYTDANQIYTADHAGITNDAAGKEKVAKALAAHGVSVVSVYKGGNGQWRVVGSDPRNRRITGTTPMAFSGPVRADHPLLQSSITPIPRGTLNNCAHGVTPWDTYLTCEENWNGYFGTDDAAWQRNPLEARYGVTAAGFGYNWHKAEPRFDVAVNRNELNHFGWVVEIDPFNPHSRPVKRTALGRIKHEGATCTESKGRVVVYSGDDENGDYLYKFVGSAPWRQLRARGLSPLDHGRLYVAKFNGDGSGEWLPLVHGEGPLTTTNGWLDQADVLIRTRMAADAVGATRLHRPEWVSVHPQTQEVYLTLTNGTGNNSAVNSGRDPNPYGHIVKFAESPRSDTEFAWDVFLLAGDPAFDASVPAGQPIFGSPDGIWVDPTGIVWIQTDISNGSQNRSNYANIGNNMMLAADPRTGEVKRFLTGPRGCEITGVGMTPDMRTMFINVQHPGESTTFWNAQFGAPTPANPTTVSSWPYGRRPRPATVVITKLDGGRIGT
jgi:secreted PhoX family phosphatase